MRSTVEGLRLLARAMPAGFWERAPGLRQRLIRVAIRLQSRPARPRSLPLPPPPGADEAGEWIRPTAGLASAVPGPPATTGLGHGKAMILLPSLGASGAARFVIDLLAHAPKEAWKPLLQHPVLIL